MSKFLLTTHQAPTDQIVSAADLEFLGRSSDGLTAVLDPVGQCPSDEYILVADQDDAGVWTTDWMLRTDYIDIQQNIQLALRMKNKRNALLAASDWTQGKDISAEVSSKWTAYRQNLRDLTTQAGFPTNVVWPSQP